MSSAARCPPLEFCSPVLSMSGIEGSASSAVRGAPQAFCYLPSDLITAVIALVAFGQPA